MNPLFLRKPISQLQTEAVGEGGEHTLKRTLNAWGLVSLGIGAIIGAGLFSITGPAAADHAGPAIVLSFVLAALGCAFAGLCYSEFAAMIPIAGSAYTYAYATLGEFLAWIIGWDLVLEYAMGAATVSISWSQYLLQIFQDLGINYPVQLAMSPWTTRTLQDGSTVTGLVNLPAIFIVVVLSLLLMRGIKESARLNNIMVVLKVVIVLVFIGVGISYIDPLNYTPFIPENTGTFGEFGISGVLRAAGIVFFAYIGFDAVSTAAQEAKNPGRDMPRGIIGSLLICTVLYIIFALVMTGMANYTEFKGSLAPVGVAIDKTPYVWLKLTIKFAIIAGYTSVILVMLLGQSRVFFSMSKDGLLPRLFSDLHPKFKTPYKSNLIFLIAVGLFAGFVPGSVVGELVSIGTLLAFVLVCIGILVLRKTNPEMERPFRTPWVPVVPILGVVSCLVLMAWLPFDTWIRLGVWLLIGFVIYFAYSRRRSKLQNTQAAK